MSLRFAPAAQETADFRHHFGDVVVLLSFSNFRSLLKRR